MKPKLFPRNLTARAAYLVEGNPATSRPESGTDVCTPGLEIDLRALEERFFPGLLWDFERPDTAKLVDMDENVKGLRRSECFGKGPRIFLWALYGRVNSSDKEPSLFGFEATGGRTAWRRVRDLAKGRIAILFGVETATKPARATAQELLLAAYGNPNKPHIERDGKRFVMAAMAADRREYLDRETGVIAESYTPGELTKGLCAPWQFDFRDCGCNYWAAAKPDMVKSADPDVGYLNFNRNRTKFPNAPDSPRLAERKAAMYTEAEMVGGAWKALPTVVGDFERNEQSPQMRLSGHDLFTGEQVAAELGYLATVEHALVVEYLYASYSVDTTAEDAKAAADVVRLIAVDEMRHFLWVNELLQIMRYEPSTGRAAVIGADPGRAIGSCGRKRLDRSYLHIESKLCPLTLKTLDYFIEVEKNSRTLNGLYSHLYLSVEASPKIFPERDRLLPILRLIIDEGEEHFQRLSMARALLTSREGEWWLRKLTPPRRKNSKQYREAANYYHLLLDVIAVAFRLDEGGPLLLKMAKDVMREMDEEIRKLMEEGLAFDWPLPKATLGQTIVQAVNQLDRRVAAISRPSSRVRALLAQTSVIARGEALAETAPRRTSLTPCRYAEPVRRSC